MRYTFMVSLLVIGLACGSQRDSEPSAGVSPVVEQQPVVELQEESLEEERRRRLKQALEILDLPLEPSPPLRSSDAKNATLSEHSTPTSEPATIVTEWKTVQECTEGVRANAPADIRFITEPLNPLFIYGSDDIISSEALQIACEQYLYWHSIPENVRWVIQQYQRTVADRNLAKSAGATAESLVGQHCRQLHPQSFGC